MYKNDRVTRRYSEPFKLKILAELSTGKYSKYELVKFFSEYPKKEKVLDLSCGQGRDAIALARLGYSVTGIDNSKVGIEQMYQIGQDENLNLVGQVDDIYAFDRFNEFNIVLLDSMFHFAKKDKKKEIGLINRSVAEIRTESIGVVCIQDTGDKVQTLNQAIDFDKSHKPLADKEFKYGFEDSDSGHKSETDYRMIVIEK